MRTSMGGCEVLELLVIVVGRGKTDLGVLLRKVV